MTIAYVSLSGDRAEMPRFRTLARRYWRMIALFAIVGLAAGAVFTAAVGNSYASSVQVQVTPTVDVQLGPVALKQLVNVDTESAIVRSDLVLGAFEKTIRSTASFDAMRKNVKVAGVAGESALTVTYKASSSSEASSGALALVNAYLAHRHDETAAALNGELALLTTQIANAQTTISTLEREIASLQNHAVQCPLRPSLFDCRGPNSGPAAELSRELLAAQQSEATVQLDVLLSRQKQLKRVVITSGKVEIAPSTPKPALPPWPITVAGGGLVGLLLGCVAAVFRERRADSRPILRLARSFGASAIVSHSGAAGATTDLQSVIECLDPKPGSIAVVTAVGRASSTKLARALAELSAQSRNPTLLVTASSPPEASLSEIGVAGPLTAEQVAEVAVPVEGIERLATFSVSPNDPVLLGDVFFAALSSLARNNDSVVIVDAPPLNAASQGEVVLRHADTAIVVAERRLAQQTVRDARPSAGFHARVVIAQT